MKCEMCGFETDDETFIEDGICRNCEAVIIDIRMGKD